MAKLTIVVAYVPFMVAAFIEGLIVGPVRVMRETHTVFSTSWDYL